MGFGTPPARPTKEIFYHVEYAMGGAAWSQIYGHTGVFINADAESAVIECYVPWDFHTLVDFTVLFIPVESVAPMTLQVETSYGKVDEPSDNHASALSNFSINTIMDRIQELDISSKVTELEANDYIGVLVVRAATQNTNMIVLGVRLRYT